MTEFERGFKEGVEKATAPLYTAFDEYQYPVMVNKKLEERRKNLLTRKVTKWVNLWKQNEYIITGQTALYDNEATARKTAKELQRPLYIGTYPIEIKETL